MAKLKSLASEVIKKMKEEGRVQTLTFQQSSSIDHELAIGLEKVKHEFEVKEKNSRIYVSKIELASISL